MAILDAFTQLSNAQAVTTSAASTNIIDLYSELGDALEAGAWLRIAVQTTFVIPGPTQTITAQVQTGETEVGFANAVTLASSTALTNPAAGTEVLVMRLPKNVKRYLRVYYVMGGTASAGNIDAHVLLNVDSLITDVEGT